MSKLNPNIDAPTVLIVDDDRDIADMYAFQLGAGYTVRTAYSGKQAIDALDGSVDVLLLDRKMPRFSGQRVLQQVQASEYDCRVIIVTAVDPEFDLLDLPCDDYLCKPVSKLTLEAAVEQQLAARSYDDPVQELLGAVSKLAVLEATQTDSELAASIPYQQLKRRVTAIRREAESSLAELAAIESAFTAIDRSVMSNQQQAGI